MPAKGRATRTKDEMQAKKDRYLEKVINCLETYPRFFVVTCDNIGSKHMQDIRISLRQSGSVLLMGKNTLMRKAIRSKLNDHPEWNDILPILKNNIGLVMTKGSLQDLRVKLLENTVPAVAKAGVVAPDDVVLPKQVTNLEPTKTPFFAALDIATKITKGTIEILNDVRLCERGKKVGSSEATLLQMMDIKPFTYGLKLVQCWEGSIFAPAFLDFTEETLFRSLSVGISTVASLSLAISYPTMPALRHVIANGFKNLAAVALETNYTFPAMEELKRRVENPDAYAQVAAAVPSAASSTTSASSTVEKKEEVKEPVKEESEDEGAGDGLMDFF